ncbi:MAG: alcohol dehydrogenase catalytic domain-containing protein [Synergistaceae bacterium]|nr:alcohol dehydrogenase catalytic domain-containing protein [Synergistaceae bacterium]
MAENMRAVIFEGDGVVKCVERPVPALKSKDGALLRILAASVCGSDLGITSIPQKHFATPGVILGHECVAQIVDMMEENPEFKVGDRVLVNPMIPCGDCAYCKVGQVNMCERVGAVGEDCDGVFAEYYAAGRSSLYHIGDDVGLDTAIFAEPLACVMNGFKRLGFMPGQNVLIYGAGPIGLLFAKLMKTSGASCVMLCETRPARLDFAREFSGADRVADTSSEDARQVIFGATGRYCADIIVDTTGSMFEAAIAHAAAEGKILLFGINDKASQNVRQYDITRKELQVIGSYATHLTFPNVIKLLSNNVLDLKPLLTHRVTLEELPDGIEALRRGEAMKVVVYP